MADLKQYDVEINGMKTTLRLSEADAKKRGLTRPSKAAAEPSSAPVKAPAQK